MMFRQEKRQQEWNYDKNSNWNHGTGDSSDNLHTDLVRNTHRISKGKDVHAVSCRICTSLGTGVCLLIHFQLFSGTDQVKTVGGLKAQG